MSKKSSFRGPFHKQHGKWDQTLLKSEQQHLYHIHWSLSRQLSWKKSLLVICKILGLFLNTLTVSQKYFFLSREKLTQPIQMHLSQKQKFFSQYFSAFLKSRISFEHFQIKYDHHSWCISESMDSEKRGYLNVWKVALQRILRQPTWQASPNTA